MSIVAHGDPRALAKWAYKSLRSKQWGVPHVLVVGDGTAQLLNMRRVGAKKAERDCPERIAGYYLGCKHRVAPYVTASDLLEAIEATLGEVA